MAVLIVLLVMASMASFGAAYYLFSTRWARQDILAAKYATDNLTTPQADLSDTPNAERYLTYLPHGGFHNQRIALENAFTMSHILNRTLVLPPVRLGKPVHYSASEQLRFMLGQSGKEGLRHCQGVQPRPVECLDYFDYTYLPWDWFVDLRNMTTGYVPLSEFSEEGFKDVYTLADDRLYDYRFVDSITGGKDKFSQHVLLSDLNAQPQKLLRLGTLFGTSRLHLGKANSHILKTFRRAMVFTNPTMLSVSKAIAHAMGNRYLAVHVRLSDGQFKQHVDETIRDMWWAVMRDQLAFTDEEALGIERNMTHSDALQAPAILGQARVTEARSVTAPQASNSVACHGQLHSSAASQRLNTVLFIATDVSHPWQSPVFDSFRRTFPCLFFLDDFAEILNNLDGLVNAYDGLDMKGFILPFLDALVAGLAESVIGTKDSTFSMFVQDILWRTEHGLDIL